MTVEKLQADLLSNSEKLVFGSERSLKFLKNGKLEKIYLSNNCKADLREEIQRHSKDVEIVELGVLNTEAGVVCKKTFPITVIGLLK